MKFNQRSNITFTVEAEGFEGVKRIAQKVAVDFEKIIGVKPVVTYELTSRTDVVFATVGQSGQIDALVASGVLDLSEVTGKREVYQITFIDETLYVIGSDKRGTIYGMFAISEYIGISPLHFWGDVEPEQHIEILINDDIQTVSKEPSVKYRGFFINDEWPCFGNWTFNHFGGFSSQMYDHVFELLLRLKGNYLWPAMWTSSFALDGPGGLNEELADIYGVVMGASHHEPCLRASEEWNKVRGPESPYGNNWCYFRNKEGLNKYWEDGIKRSGKYENIPMLGMRGEADSEILGKDATLKDNIDLLKDVIVNQRELFKAHGNPNNPQMLAIYKEVEAFFYGDENTEGLKDWDGLDDVICMFCEDNFGFVRTLPNAGLGDRRYGMYYHFDYHGGPISYEWMPSTAFERTWEQMSTAYDYGVRDVWVVNVGDLKFNEVPLNYFMDLAYDFEKWGTTAPNMIDTYQSEWVAKTFPTVAQAVQEKMAFVLKEYINMNAKRRPEALNPSIYHPAHYLEADQMLKLAQQIEAVNTEVLEGLKGKVRDAYYSLIGLPARASVNLLRMHVYAAINAHYAGQGKKVANRYADLVTGAIEKDRGLFADFAEFKGGKWRGMELEEHIGFTTWNDDGYKYPVRMMVEPVHKPRLVVSRKDDAAIKHKAYGAPMKIVIEDFLSAGNTSVIVEIANDGVGVLNFELVGDLPNWLSVNATSGAVEEQFDLEFVCDRDLLSQTPETINLFIKDGETTVAIDISARAHDANLPPMTHLANNGIITMSSADFVEKKFGTDGEFISLKGYGRTGHGEKVYPTTANFTESDDKPEISYQFNTEQTGKYVVEVWTTPTNPMTNNTPIRFALSGGTSAPQTITTVDKDFVPFHTDARWSSGVLDNIRKTSATMTFDAGVNRVTIGALEAGLILERILIYLPEHAPKPSYLGPKNSFIVE